ncbi:MAG TPA: hypothetical protein VF763_06005 [Candidatus Limnocylindrales bacterium]
MVSSNIGQSYPYSSESASERASRVEATLAAHAGLQDKVAGETTPLGDDPVWWVWKCTVPGCSGFLHVAGYARDSHAIYAVCDANGHTALR